MVFLFDFPKILWYNKYILKEDEIMQKITIVFLDELENEQTLILTDLIAFKETFFSVRSELQIIAQDKIVSDNLVALMNFAQIKKIVLQKENADGTMDTSEFTNYSVFEKVTQDFKGEKTSTTFQAFYVYNK